MISQPGTVEYDWLSGTLLSHLSFILCHLILLRHVPPIPVPGHPALEQEREIETRHLIPHNLHEKLAKMNEGNQVDSNRPRLAGVVIRAAC